MPVAGFLIPDSGECNREQLKLIVNLCFSSKQRAQLNYGSVETTSGIFLFKKARSQCAAFNLDALYAWHQQNIAVHVHFRTYYNYY